MLREWWFDALGSDLQEQFWHSALFHNHLDYLAKHGYEYEESTKHQAVKEQQELLMKMLAVSEICRNKI